MLAIELKGKWLERVVGLKDGHRLVVLARKNEIVIRKKTAHESRGV
jgi:hypothetical protein